MNNMNSRYRHALPQLKGGTFLTDGGTETYLIYKKNLTLPDFSAFHCLADEDGYRIIKQYYRDHARLAVRYGVGFIFCSITYRASRDWGELLGYSKQALASINKKAIEMFQDVAAEFETHESPMVFSGCIGPRGDAYKLDKVMSADESEDYHAEQITTFEAAGIDMITGLTINNTDEAIGIVRASQHYEIPCVISFTVQRNGLLRTGQPLKEAIAEVDEQTNKGPAYYMINCAHPLEFGPVLENAEWVKRIRGIRSNASSLEHGILCKLGHLEEGNPVELGIQHGQIARRFPHINVWGGCCGTDHVHIEEICKNVLEVR